MKIAVVGTGYVGLSNAMLLAQHNEVVAVDVIAGKIALLNAKQSPIEDTDIEDFFCIKSSIFLQRWMLKKLIKMQISSSLPRRLIMIPRPIILIHQR